MWKLFPVLTEDCALHVKDAEFSWKESNEKPGTSSEESADDERQQGTTQNLHDINLHINKVFPAVW